MGHCQVLGKCGKKVTRNRVYYSALLAGASIPSASWSKFPLPPFHSPFLPSSILSLPLSSAPFPPYFHFLSLLISLPFSPNSARGLEERCELPCSDPRRILNEKIWHLVRIIVVAFMKNYIDSPPVSGKTVP